MSNLYETDFYAWTQEQAELLRHKQWGKIDLPNLLEEIESLRKQQRQELRNRLSVLLGHLLKWQYQAERRTRSWLATIRLQRRETIKLLVDNFSLKSYLPEALQSAYENGKDLAMGETNLALKTFPSECAYSFEQIVDNEFYPGEPSFDIEEL